MKTMTDDSEYPCKCFDPAARYDTWDKTYIGCDETNGRFGDVELFNCKTCGRCWLHYLVEYEAFTSSGRWYRGLIAPDQVASITPQNAVAILESLPWHFYGGSYFETYGKKGSGSIIVD